MFGLKVRLGEHNISDTAEELLERKDIAVKRVTVHEEYKSGQSFNNDIAILELAQEVDLTEYTPVCMAKADDYTTFDDKKAWAYGEIMLRTCDLL